MARRPLELTPEAQALIAQVSGLHDDLKRLRREMSAELAGVRAAAEAEISRVRRSQWDAAPGGTPERQASRLAAEIDRMMAEHARLGAERDRLAGEVERLALEREQTLAVATATNGAKGSYTELLAARDRGELESDLDRLRGERERIQDDLRQLATEREQLGAERDALVAESERVVEQRLVETRRRIAEQERVAQLGLDAQRAAVAADREAFEASVAGRRTLLTEQIAEAWKEYEWLRAELQANVLDFRDRPAPKAAETVRAKGHELGEAKRAAKRAEWALAFYEGQFPWLAELRDLEAEDDYVAGGDQLEAELDADGRREDPARHWLSPEEFKALSDAERNQRALDRYLKSRKSPWQLGRDYERYIGYLREQAGFRVTYHGIFKGLEDLGRDLLAERDDEIEVIQCKRWAQRKTIHEKHIFQLLGTVLAARLENPDKTVRGTFTTTTQLSDRARQFAEMLDIRVEESVPLGDYPWIKCNIARRDEARIYHLPFDQQYDTTVVEPERGERYAATVAEAEALGFRRAWRWKPAPVAS